MESQFLGFANRLQELKRNIDELNSKLISYIELASDNVSEKQIEDDLAFVEKSSSLGEEIIKPGESARQPSPVRTVLACPEELIRLLLVQANSVEGMIVEL